MNMPFFITGYPRSRTAWCANWLTTDNSLCFHEPKETVEELMGQYPQYRVGVSSCMLVREFFALVRQFPKAPWVFIEREKAACRQSMLGFAKGRLTGQAYDGLIQVHFTASKIIKDHPQTMVVDYEDLDKHLPAVWNHVLPERPFNAVRAHLLTELKVEQRLEAAEDRILNGRKTLWPLSQ